VNTYPSPWRETEPSVTARTVEGYDSVVDGLGLKVDAAHDALRHSLEERLGSF